MTNTTDEYVPTGGGMWVLNPHYVKPARELKLFERYPIKVLTTKPGEGPRRIKRDGYTVSRTPGGLCFCTPEGQCFWQNYGGEANPMVEGVDYVFI